MSEETRRPSPQERRKKAQERMASKQSPHTIQTSAPPVRSSSVHQHSGHTPQQGSSVGNTVSQSNHGAFSSVPLCSEILKGSLQSGLILGCSIGIASAIFYRIPPKIMVRNTIGACAMFMGLFGVGQTFLQECRWRKPRR
eukprot:TRINITY_DN3578_c0_g1_i2.p1 TRINITY_DN3578_c0_g1~~TRINITY_DN3578_c0_g1_i2.p1  ORF type:complete len:151 (-),score=15.90 TRINITY_DN3578_c0_g1_i2:40-459(-)